MESLLKTIIRYRTQIITGVVVSILVTIALIPLRGILEEVDQFNRSFLILQLVTLIVLVFFTFYIKKLYYRRIDTQDDLLYDIFGYTWQNSQYFKRKRHFTSEKDLLGKITVDHALINILGKIRKEKHNSHKIINIIIDSGTTLTPIFKYLPDSDLPKLHDKTQIHTNNISGIEELFRVDPSRWKFKETDFFLIDGNPLGRYRATTYDEIPHPYLAKLWSLQEEKKTINLSIITGNWIMASNGLKELSICAKGRGHPEFKRELIEKSDYLLVVAPLGKILRINNIETLNDITPEKEKDYESISIPLSKKDQTTLLTTFRSMNSKSVLKDHSQNLQTLMEKGDTFNYHFFEQMPAFEPRNESEVPHDYLLGKNFRKAYGYNMKK